jgi:hypothetical protein
MGGGRQIVARAAFAFVFVFGLLLLVGFVESRRPQRCKIDAFGRNCPFWIVTRVIEVRRRWRGTQR